MNPCDPQPLSLLLDVSSVASSALIPSRFTQIAEALLHRYYLRIEYQDATSDFEILEVEFYLQKDAMHEDPFCHAHDDQENSAQWYFHRVPKRHGPPIKPATPSTNAPGYRGGTRKGLDLTFGSPVSSSYFPANKSTSCRGGILLRSMRQCDKNAQVISGPSLLVDKILSITGSRNIPELTTTRLGGYTSAFPPSGDSSAWNSYQSRMYFTPRPRDLNGPLPNIHRSPRVGLDLSHPSASPQRSNSRVVYLAKLYRYFVRPEILKANGRCHTFIGLLLESVSDPASISLVDKPELLGSLAESMSISRPTIVRYLEDYADGFKNGGLVKYVGASGKGVCSSPQLFMRMMGVFARMGLLNVLEEC